MPEEAAILDSPETIAPVDDPNPSLEEVAADGLDAVENEAEFEEDTETEEVDEISEDDPRAARLKAEFERRKEQALRDQKAALERERETAAERARREERMRFEREAASREGREKRLKDIKGVVQEILDSEDIDAVAPEKWEALESSLFAGAERRAMDGLHELGQRYMTAHYGQFYMPPEFIPHYNRAVADGNKDVAAGIVMESVRTLAYREGWQAREQALEKQGAEEETADQRAERIRQERAQATAPGAQPSRRSGAPARNRPRTQVEAAQWFNDGRITAEQYQTYRRGDNPLPYQ